jgi:hypothetical protein
MGRKEVRALLKQYSLVIAYAGGDDFKISEAYTKGSIRRRDPGGPVGVREHGESPMGVRESDLLIVL